MAPPLNKGRRIVKINAMSQVKLIALMLDGVYTCEQLAEGTGLHYVTVLQYTRELHRAKAKKAHALCQLFAGKQTA